MIEEEKTDLENLYKALQDNMKSGKVLTISADNSDNSVIKAQQLGAYVDRPSGSYMQSRFKEGTALMIVCTPYDQDKYHYRNTSLDERAEISGVRFNTLRSLNSHPIGNQLKDVILIGDFSEHQVGKFAKSHPDKRCWFFGKDSPRKFVVVNIQPSSEHPSLTLIPYTGGNNGHSYLEKLPILLQYVTQEGKLRPVQRTSLDLPHCGRSHRENQDRKAVAVPEPSATSAGAQMSDPATYAAHYQQLPSSYDGQVPTPATGSSSRSSVASASQHPDPSAHVDDHRQFQFRGKEVGAPAFGAQQYPFGQPLAFLDGFNPAQPSSDTAFSNPEPSEVDFQNFGRPQTTVKEKWNAEDQAALDMMMAATAHSDTEYGQNQASGWTLDFSTNLVVPVADIGYSRGIGAGSNATGRAASFTSSFEPNPNPTNHEGSHSDDWLKDIFDLESFPEFQSAKVPAADHLPRAPKGRRL